MLWATPRVRQIAGMPAIVTPRVIDLPNLIATQALAAGVAALTHEGDAILLEGELGAGKTEFVRAFLRAASRDPTLEVPSPTFTLVQSYDTPLGAVHHFDLWRLEGPGALMELDWDQARDDVVLVEWPDRLGALHPKEALVISLTATGADSRRAVLSGWAERLSLIG